MKTEREKDLEAAVKVMHKLVHFLAILVPPLLSVFLLIHGDSSWAMFLLLLFIYFRTMA